MRILFEKENQGVIVYINPESLETFFREIGDKIIINEDEFKNIENDDK